MIETLDTKPYTSSTCEQLELEAIFSELTDNTPAEMTFTTLKTLPGGQCLPCAQTVQVLDAGLLQRISYLKPGDKIKVRIETDWASKDIITVLKACTPTL